MSLAVSNESFGANVFTLYRNIFLLENGLVGEFAQQKIRKIEENIKNNETNETRKEINLIGDERIRTYLLRLYLEHCNSDSNKKEILIQYYKNLINELEKEQ